MATKKLPPIHPGEVLREDFLAPMKLSPYAVARAARQPLGIHMQRRVIHCIYGEILRWSRRQRCLAI